MSKPEELRDFANEEDFRNRFLVPLLYRLGFSIVVNNHGAREFGRDIIFGEIDRFGHVVYYGLQAKYLDSIGQSDSHSLAEDARESFVHEFTHPQREVKQRTSRFYAVNAGAISENARETFFALLEKQFAANSVVIDGTGLLALDKWAAFNRGTFTRELLTGVLLEIRWNRRVSQVLAEQLPLYLAGNPYPMQRYRLAAVLAFLERPVISDDSALVAFQTYHELSRIINDIVDSVGVSITSGTFKQDRVACTLPLISQVDGIGQKVEGAITAVLMNLGSMLL